MHADKNGTQHTLNVYYDRVYTVNTPGLRTPRWLNDKFHIYISGVVAASEEEEAQESAVYVPHAIVQRAPLDVHDPTKSNT